MMIAMICSSAESMPITIGPGTLKWKDGSVETRKEDVFILPQEDSDPDPIVMGMLGARALSR